MKALLVKTLFWFGLYVGVVLGFSLVYWKLYLAGPHHFRVAQSPFNQSFLIVPNSTQARRFVFCEILIGLFLTLFFIHFLMRWRREQSQGGTA